LVKCTSNEEELLNIKRSFERSKIILNHVNQAVREAEDQLRLSDIQKKLDASPFEKVDHPLSVDYKVKKLVINYLLDDCLKIILFHFRHN